MNVGEKESEWVKVTGDWNNLKDREWEKESWKEWEGGRETDWKKSNDASTRDKMREEERETWTEKRTKEIEKYIISNKTNMKIIFQIHLISVKSM